MRGEMAQDLKIHRTDTHRCSEMKRQQHLLKSHATPGGFGLLLFPKLPCLHVVNVFLVSTFLSAGSRKHQLLLNSQDLK